MKKKKGLILSGILLLISLNIISAIDLDISSNPISNSFIIDLNEPAIFDLTIRNLEETDQFEIYSLVGVDISPKEFEVESGKTKTLRINLMPQEPLKSKKGFFTFEYKIKNSENEIQRESLTMNIVSLEDVFRITPSTINPKSEEVEISIKNQIRFDFSQLTIKLTSAFFDHEENLSLNALETKEFTIQIDKEKLKILNAGDYLINARITAQEETASKELIIKFLEQEDIETTETKEGGIIKRHEIIKKNQGNIKKKVKITAEKNILSYLFTTVNIVPTETKLTGLNKQYIWEKELIPNEELKIIIKTNWFFPIIIIILIILVIYFIKRSIERDLILRKKVSFVKTKGGQFALKVSLRIRSKKFIERINIIDKLPQLVKLYERYGAIAPDKIDLQNRRLEWNIESLNKDEERIFTYIIYSRIGVVGRFELPNARATYEKEGKIKQITSNRSFFINEPGQ